MILLYEMGQQECDLSVTFDLLRVGLGRKSVACILLLSLQAHDFPVDTNVGRIYARLGWLPFDQEKPLEVCHYAHPQALCRSNPDSFQACRTNVVMAHQAFLQLPSRVTFKFSRGFLSRPRRCYRSLMTTPRSRRYTSTFTAD